MARMKCDSHSRIFKNNKRLAVKEVTIGWRQRSEDSPPQIRSRVGAVEKGNGANRLGSSWRERESGQTLPILLDALKRTINPTDEQNQSSRIIPLLREPFPMNFKLGPVLALMALVAAPCVAQTIANGDNVLGTNVACDTPTWSDGIDCCDSTCGDPDCEECDGTCDACGRGRPLRCQLWGGVDFMLLWNKGRNTPPLITTSTAGTIRDQAGVLGFPGTRTLFGNEQIGDDLRVGGRLTFGSWLDRYQRAGAMLRFYGMERDKTRFDAASQGDPILGRPFFDLDLDRQNASLSAFPGEIVGDVHARTANEWLGGDVLGRFLMVNGDDGRIDLIGGYQVARINDDLSLFSRSTITDPSNVLQGAVFDIRDSFRTQNEFHGGSLGLMGEKHRGRVKLTWLAKVGLGNMRERVTMSGRTDVAFAGANNVTTRGLYVQDNNTGIFERNRLTYSPEVNIALAFYVTDYFNVSVGYMGIYYDNVVLAADQINPNVSLAGGYVGAPNQQFRFRETDYWVQGVTFGGNWNF